MIIKAETEGDKFKILHGEDVSPYFKENYESRKDPRNGFTQDRQHQKVMSIPPLLYHEYIQKYPELLNGDPVEQDKILKRMAREHPEIICAGGSIF